MAFAGFKAQNHPQQVGKRGAKLTVDNLATTPEMFAPLHERFRFTIDACALPHNTKLERYFAPPNFSLMKYPIATSWPSGDTVAVAQDGLAQSWQGERVWCNPPYSSIEPWVQKAWFEWDHLTEGEAPVFVPRRAELIVMLLPANRTEQGWWQRQVEPWRDTHDFSVEFLPGRPRFIRHGFEKVEPNQRPPFGCCLLIWGAR